MTTSTRHDVPGSFRDPNGVVYEFDGALYREVRYRHRPHYDHLMGSGLYDALVRRGLLIEHVEAPLDASAGPDTYRVLRPELVPFVSYPYEWCFSQLQAAARATLEIQRIALRHGMSLRDASAYNIQFHRGHPVLIDTLSLERYDEGSPWVAYRQFCQHFVAPLALMAYCDVRLGNFLRSHLDGVPLDLAVSLLPWKARLRPGLLIHLYLHARTQRRHAGNHDSAATRNGRLSRNGMEGLVDSLDGTVRKLAWRPDGTEWADYEQGDSYTPNALDHKSALVREFISTVRPDSVWDLGANTGRFSQIAAGLGIPTVAFDLDAGAVERHWRSRPEQSFQKVLPLVVDLTNPSPASGWAHEERMSIVERGPAGMTLALALIHHLVIANNVPLGRVAEFMARLAPWLVIEFVPREDPKVGQLLAHREDIFDGYTQPGFERAFESYFEIDRVEPIRDSQRVLYLLRRK